MTFELPNETYERQMQEIKGEMDNCIQSNTSKFEKYLIMLCPKLILKIFKVKKEKTYGSNFSFNEHIKIYKKDKLIYQKVVNYGQ